MSNSNCYFFFCTVNSRRDSLVHFCSNAKCSAARCCGLFELSSLVGRMFPSNKNIVEINWFRDKFILFKIFSHSYQQRSATVQAPPSSLASICLSQFASNPRGQNNNNIGECRKKSLHDRASLSVFISLLNSIWAIWHSLRQAQLLFLKSNAS